MRQALVKFSCAEAGLYGAFGTIQHLDKLRHGNEDVVP